MSRVIAATGQVAQRPYRLEKIERNVWSAEELCYLLVQSAQILDAGIMDPELVAWISDELRLPDLAEKLRPLLGKERALADFVGTILDYVGLVSPTKEQAARQIVRTVSTGRDGLEPFNRRMERAKFFEENAQPYEALREYDALAGTLPVPEKRLRTEALCAEGRILAGMFRWHQAAEFYKKAYDVAGSSDIFLLYLAAVRMELPNAEYLAFISEHPEAYNASLELEKRMEKLNSAYDASDRKASIDLLKSYRENHQDASYEIALHRMVQQMKKEYRDRQNPEIASV